MKTVYTMQAESRDRLGKGASRALRRSGRIPAVLYGNGQNPLSFSLDGNEFTQHYHKGGFTNKLVEIKLDGKSYHVLPREIQTHPVTDVPEHLDFLVVTENSRVNVEVPVRVLNVDRCAGVKLGGSINMVRHAVELVCAPDSIPPVIKIDVAKLNIGDSVHISQVELPAGVTSAITDRDFTILTVAGRAPLEEEPVEGEEESVEVEATAQGGEEGEAPAEEAKGEE